jgi:hypothetical protein
LHIEELVQVVEGRVGGVPVPIARLGAEDEFIGYHPVEELHHSFAMVAFESNVPFHGVIVLGFDLLR